MAYLHFLSTLVQKVETWWCSRVTVKLHIVAGCSAKKMSNKFIFQQNSAAVTWHDLFLTSFHMVVNQSNESILGCGGITDNHLWYKFNAMLVASHFLITLHILSKEMTELLAQQNNQLVYINTGLSSQTVCQANLGEII